MAITTMAFSIGLANPKVSIIGTMMEAVVMSATVDEPCAVLIAADKRNGSQMLRCTSAKTLLSNSAIPESCNTLPKIPPAPVIKKLGDKIPQSDLRDYSRHTRKLAWTVVKIECYSMVLLAVGLIIPKIM